MTTTTRLNPIEALLARLTGMPAASAVACGNWARLNDAATPVPTRPGMIVTVDPAVLAAAARRCAQPPRPESLPLQARAAVPVFTAA